MKIYKSKLLVYNICLLIILSAFFFTFAPVHAASAYNTALVPEIYLFNAKQSEIYSFGVGGIFDYDEAYEVLARLNSLRTGLGLPELSLSKRLTDAAMQRAADTSIFFNHTRPDGGPFHDAINITAYTRLGENLAVGYRDASKVMEGWISSPGHYENMIHPAYNAVGVACFYQDNGMKYWVQEFGGGIPPDPVTETGKISLTYEVRALSELLKLDISPKSVSIPVGGVISFTLTNTYNTGFPSAPGTRIMPSYIFSDNTLKAAIDKDGIVTGVRAGNVKIKLGVGEDLYREADVSVLIGLLTESSFKTTGSPPNMQFVIKTGNPLNNAVIILALYDIKSGKLLYVKQTRCDGRDEYIINVPACNNATAKIYVWDSLSKQEPLGYAEILNLP